MVRKLLAFLHSLTWEARRREIAEQYLADAQSIYDLEKRIREMEERGFLDR